MGYLFPFVGSTRKIRPPKPKPAPAKRAEPPPPPPEPEFRTQNLPNMAPLLKTLMLEVCRKHSIQPDDMVGSSQLRALVMARKEFIVRARLETACSWMKLARALKKDHTSIMHHWRRYAAGEEIGDPFVPKPVNKPGRDRVTPLSRAQAAAWGHHMAGKTLFEVAEAMGIKPKSAREHIRYARLKIIYQSASDSNSDSGVIVTKKRAI